MIFKGGTCQLYTTYIYNTWCNEYSMQIFRFKDYWVIGNQKDLPKSTVTSWVRTKISFALIRSMLICLRGSRSIKSSTIAINNIDMQENLTISIISIISTIYIYIYIYVKKNCNLLLEGVYSSSNINNHAN